MSTKEKLVPPETPSKGINTKLEEFADKATQSPVMAVLVRGIFSYFLLAVMAHRQLNALKALEGKLDAKQMWMLSLGLVCVLIMIVSTVVYNVIMSLSFLFVWLVYYSFVVLSLSALGISVWGSLSFQDAKKGSAVPRPKVNPPPAPTTTPTPDSQEKID